MTRRTATAIIRAAARQDAHTWLIQSATQPSALAELYLYARHKGADFDEAAKLLGDHAAWTVYSGAFDVVMERAA